MTRTLPIHLRFATTDPAAVKDKLSRTYKGADIRPPRDDPAFVYRQEVNGDTDLALGRFHFGGRGQVNLVLEDRFTVARLRSGQHQWEVDGHRGTGLMIIQPRQDYRAVLEFMRVETVDLSLTTLAQKAHTVYGDDRVKVAFDNPRPVSPAMAHCWEGTHEIIHQGLTDPDIASIPLLHADLLRRMTVATLDPTQLDYPEPCTPAPAATRRRPAWATSTDAARRGTSTATAFWSAEGCAVEVGGGDQRKLVLSCSAMLAATSTAGPA